MTSRPCCEWLSFIANQVDWWHGTLKFAAPKLIDQVGMLLLVGAVLLTGISPSNLMRIVIFALILIVPSTALMVVHAL